MSSKLISPALRAALHLNSSKLPAETSQLATAYLSSAPAGGKHELPSLKYDYGALEPTISSETMTIHHTKHHQTYVTNLNAALEKLDAAVTKSDAASIISLSGALKFNGGGHINHTLFWENLCPKDNSEFPSGGVLKTAVEERFGSVEKLKKELSDKSIAVQGSGWGWLGYDVSTGKFACCSLLSLL
jgi:Fe-Mn family superoxide dismutase